MGRRALCFSGCSSRLYFCSGGARVGGGERIRGLRYLGGVGILQCRFHFGGIASVFNNMMEKTSLCDPIFCLQMLRG